MGEWVNATKTLVFGACVDTQRREQAALQPPRPLDGTDDAGEDTGRWTAMSTRRSRSSACEQEAAEQDADDDATSARAFSTGPSRSSRPSAAP